MAKKSTNQARKGRMTKAMSSLRNWFRGDKEFWTPVAIALGFTALLNGITALLNTCPTSINEWISLTLTIGAGLILILFGILIAPTKDQKFVSRIGITAGFAIFFVGTRFASSNPTIGWSITVFGLILLVVGLALAPLGNDSEAHSPK
jgi:hypothetical protein